MADKPRKQREVILVTGKTGCGKTQWTKQWLRGKSRIIALDPINEYPGIYFDDLADMIEHIQENKVFAVKSMWKHDLPMLCAIANSAQRCTLVVEEAQAMAPQSSESMPETLEDVIYRGRHYYTTPVFVAQRAATIHIAVRSQWTRLLVFAQTEESDLKWIEGATRIPRDIIRALPPLYGFDCTPWQTNPFRLIWSEGAKYATVIPIAHRDLKASLTLTPEDV